MISPPLVPKELHYTLSSGARWVVLPGETIARGQLVAAGPCRTHAAASGTVRSIAGSELIITIRADDHEITLPPVGVDDRPAILARIRDAGICGLGGGGFPTHLKMLEAARKNVHTLIVNAVECGVGISCDAALIRAEPETIARGIDVVCHLLNIRQTIIACSNRTAFEHGNARTELIPEVRPTDGAERYLVHRVAGVRVQQGERPVDHGLVVCNVATLHAVARAMEGHALLERMVTTGAVDQRVLTGTPFAALLTTDEKRTRVRIGGELDGRIVPATGAVDKRTNAIAYAPLYDSLPCIHCGACDAACPEALPVADLIAFGARGGGPAAITRHAANCIECGLCNPVCPSHIDVLGQLRELRAGQRAAELRSSTAAEALARSERHAARIAAVETSQARRRAQRLARLKDVSRS